MLHDAKVLWILGFCPVSYLPPHSRAYAGIEVRSILSCSEMSQASLSIKLFEPHPWKMNRACSSFRVTAKGDPIVLNALEGCSLVGSALPEVWAACYRHWAGQKGRSGGVARLSLFVFWFQGKSWEFLHWASRVGVLLLLCPCVASQVGKLWQTSCASAS